VVNTEGRLYNAEGELAAEATARFVKV
jgi:hypothetical protein